MFDPSTVRPTRPYISTLWRHPAFMKLWTGQTISAFGSHITGYGIPLMAILVYGATPVQMGLLTAISALPVLLLSLIIGAWVDRLPRRPLMLGADLGRMALLFLVPLAALTDHLSLPLLILVTTVSSILGLVFNVAYQSFLPVLVSAANVVEGNSKLATSESLAEVGGPAMAGLLIQLITAPLAIFFDALSFLASAISLALIRVDETALKPAQLDEPPTNLRYEIRAGIQMVTGNPLLRTMVIISSSRSFFGAFYGALYSLYAIRDLGLTPFVLGVLIGAGGVGSLIGAAMAPWLVRRFGLGRVLRGMLLIGSVGVLTPLAGGPLLLTEAMLLTAQLVNDAAMTVYAINEMSVRQTVLGDEWLGRTNATFGFMAQAVGPIGALIAGLLATVFSDRVALAISVMGGISISLWAVRSPLRAARLGSPTNLTD